LRTSTYRGLQATYPGVEPGKPVAAGCGAGDGSLPMLVLGFALGHVDRGHQVLHRFVEAVGIDRGAPLQVFDGEVLGLPMVPSPKGEGKFTPR
ncbi:MAG TPA: hypothetical protein VIV08_03505, partial [Acidimicrobiia bacterium]